MTTVTAKGHRFYASDSCRDTYECASCGMGNFTGQQIAAGDFFPCSHYLDRHPHREVTQ